MSELTKLETMYFHARQPKHIRWLENNPMYRKLRTLGRDAGLPSQEQKENEEITQYHSAATLGPVIAQMQRPQPTVGAKCVFCGNRVKYLATNGINPRTHEKCWQQVKGKLLHGK